MKKLIIILSVSLSALFVNTESNAGILVGGCVSIQESGTHLLVNCEPSDDICMEIYAGENGRTIVRIPAYDEVYEFRASAKINGIPLQQAPEVFRNNVGGQYVIQK